MKIIDEKGIIYNVNDSQKLILECDNDTLLLILEHTYYGHKLECMLQDLVSQEIIEKVNDDSIYPEDEIAEAINFLSQTLTDRLGNEKVQDVLIKVDNHMRNEL